MTAATSLDVGDCWWRFGRNFFHEKVAEDGDERHFGYNGVWSSALAAALAYPDSRIVCLTGDGGLTMVNGRLFNRFEIQVAC